MIAGVLDRPSIGTLIAATIIAVAGWAVQWWLWRSTRPPLVEPGEPVRPTPIDEGPLESPALISLLTNGYRVPPSAATATALDLSARRWLRITSSERELVVVTRSDAPAGDSLRNYEQQVFNHLSAYSYNDVVAASTIANARARLGRRWWAGFRRSIAADGKRLGLCRDRFPIAILLAVAGMALVGMFVLYTSIRNGTEVAVIDSWKARFWWFFVLGALLALLVSTVLRWTAAAQVPTGLGVERTAAWLGYRARLEQRIPANASVIGTPHQQRALATALVTGVADHLYRQLPIVRQGAKLGWSNAGGMPHTVQVRYPVRPGYGQHPASAAIAGGLLLVASLLIRGFFNGVAAGDRITSLVEKADDHQDLVFRVAEFLSLVMLVPIALAVWLLLAGVIDTLYTPQRTGSVVRTRTPAEVLPRRVERIVRPLGARSAYSTYVAVDDGNRQMVTAFLANARTSAPQGTEARVRATLLLGYVRSADPVGTSNRAV